MAGSNPFKGLTATQLVALALYGEARGETVMGRIAVGCVIRNRVFTRNQSYEDVVLAKNQFSCFSPNGGGEANYRAVVRQAETNAPDPLWIECLFLASGIVTRSLTDCTKGADHYLTTDLFHAPQCPAWAKEMVSTVAIGRHTFLKSVG